MYIDNYLDRESDSSSDLDEHTINMCSFDNEDFYSECNNKYISCSYQEPKIVSNQTLLIYDNNYPISTGDLAFICGKMVRIVNIISDAKPPLIGYIHTDKEVQGEKFNKLCKKHKLSYITYNKNNCKLCKRINNSYNNHLCKRNDYSFTNFKINEKNIQYFLDDWKKESKSKINSWIQLDDAVQKNYQYCQKLDQNLLEDLNVSMCRGGK